MMNISDRKPALFEKSNCSIWTDPYLQRQMLLAHLDPSNDAASRRPESIDKIVDFIAGTVPPGGRILDLGCGPGLYTERLAARGYEVTGIDLNGEAIAYAREHSEAVRYLEGNYITDYPAGTFDAVILIYCDFGTHSDAERTILLGNILRSLSPGGKLIFDVFDEKLADDRQEKKDWSYSPGNGFWSAEEYLLLSQTFHDPENHLFVDSHHLIQGETVRNFLVWEHYYSETEITGVLATTGFRVLSVNRNIAPQNNFTSANAMFIVAERR